MYSPKKIAFNLSKYSKNIPLLEVGSSNSSSLINLGSIGWLWNYLSNSQAARNLKKAKESFISRLKELKSISDNLVSNIDKKDGLEKIRNRFSPKWRKLSPTRLIISQHGQTQVQKCLMSPNMAQCQ